MDETRQATETRIARALRAGELDTANRLRWSLLCAEDYDQHGSGKHWALSPRTYADETPGAYWDRF
jgi:hypothetical protein